MNAIIYAIRRPHSLDGEEDDITSIVVLPPGAKSKGDKFCKFRIRQHSEVQAFVPGAEGVVKTYGPPITRVRP